MKYAVGLKVRHVVDMNVDDDEEGDLSFGTGTVTRIQKRDSGLPDLITVLFDSGKTLRFQDTTEKLTEVKDG